MKPIVKWIPISAILFLLTGCSISKKLSQTSTVISQLITDSAMVNAHVGVLVADANTGHILQAYQEQRYFVPASNTKLWTMYAGMKYLGDSLVAGYFVPANDSAIQFRSNGDPTFLHPDYALQPLAALLKQYRQVWWMNAEMKTSEYGNGWAWNDYDASYMAPRSSMPMFGNVATFARNKEGRVEADPAVAGGLVENLATFSDSGFSITRHFDNPFFTLRQGRSKKINTTLFLTPASTTQLAATYFGNDWYFNHSQEMNNAMPNYRRIYSQPTDSMLKPLMHRSDNFFAEQTLLMISNQWFGFMNEQTVIDSLLKTDFKALPQKPRWVDGSGLSRYNLFTPSDYIWLLRKMKTEFPAQRLQNILATGNSGTLSNYYKALEGKIFAKTGTLAGVVGLSGYLEAKSGRQLVFSVLVNNHNGSAVAVRRAVEKFLLQVWEEN